MTPMALPPYRYIPGKNAHPRRDPQGHSFGQPEPKAAPAAPEAWRACEIYRRGVELFNAGYYWECHEALEALWHAVGHDTPQGQFLQGVIQVAAACLQKELGSPSAGELAEKGLARLGGLGTYMGVDVPAFVRDAREHFAGRRGAPTL